MRQDPCEKTRKTIYHRDINCDKGRLSKTDIIRLNYAGYGIRTRELLRDRILSPAPLASLANPALIPVTNIVIGHSLDLLGN